MEVEKKPVLVSQENVLAKNIKQEVTPEVQVNVESETGNENDDPTVTQNGTFPPPPRSYYEDTYMQSQPTAPDYGQIPLQVTTNYGSYAPAHPDGAWYPASDVHTACHPVATNGSTVQLSNDSFNANNVYPTSGNSNQFVFDQAFHSVLRDATNDNIAQIDSSFLYANQLPGHPSAGMTHQATSSNVQMPTNPFYANTMHQGPAIGTHYVTAGYADQVIDPVLLQATNDNFAQSSGSTHVNYSSYCLQSHDPNYMNPWHQHANPAPEFTNVATSSGWDNGSLHIHNNINMGNANYLPHVMTPGTDHTTLGSQTFRTQNNHNHSITENWRYRQTWNDDQLGNNSLNRTLADSRSRRNRQRRRRKNLNKTLY